MTGNRWLLVGGRFYRTYRGVPGAPFGVIFEVPGMSSRAPGDLRIPISVLLGSEVDFPRICGVILEARNYQFLIKMQFRILFFVDALLQNDSWIWFGRVCGRSEKPQNLKSHQIHFIVVQTRSSTKQHQKYSEEVPGPNFGFWKKFENRLSIHIRDKQLKKD